MNEDGLRDLFSSLSALSFRKMFGGLGIYSNGLIFAVVLSSGELMLKGDDQCAATYEDAGMLRWTYEKKKSGKTSAMPYWHAPEEAMDSADDMEPWAQMAYEAALRASK